MTFEPVERVTKLVEPVLAEHGYELVEVQLRNESGGLVLRIVIYKEEGISVADCTLVSREVSHLMEIDDPISGAYTLEVTSPGLDRPLTTARDFSRNLKKKVKVTWEEPEGQCATTGLIRKVEDNKVILKVGNETQAIDLDSISKARLVIEF